MPVFQPLKNGQVIPLWPRNVLRVRGVGRGTQLHRSAEAQQAETDDQQCGQRKVQQDLARIEEVRFVFRVVLVFIDGAGASSLAKQKNVGGHDRKDTRGNQT